MKQNRRVMRMGRAKEAFSDRSERHRGGGQKAEIGVGRAKQGEEAAGRAAMGYDAAAKKCKA